MDKKFIEKLKKKLEQEKKSLEKELSEIATKDKVLPDDYDAKFPSYGTAIDESALEVGTFELNLDLEAKLEVALAAVNKALSKIKKQTYGICEKCERQINLERLEAFPAAKFCIQCKKKMEKGS